MDKETRNMLIMGVVCTVVGMVMGIGIVTPSVEGDYKQEAVVDEVCKDYSHSIIEATNDMSASYEKDMIECRNTFVKAQDEVMSCQDNTVKLQGQFDDATALVEETQGMVRQVLTSYDTLSESYDQLDGLFGRCMEALEGNGRVSL